MACRRWSRPGDVLQFDEPVGACTGAVDCSDFKNFVLADDDVVFYAGSSKSRSSHEITLLST